MQKNKNVYLSQYFLEGFGTSLVFEPSMVHDALKRTDCELKRRLTEAEISVKKINDLWDALNSFESDLKEYKSEFPTLYDMFEANNFTYIKV